MKFQLVWFIVYFPIVYIKISVPQKSEAIKIIKNKLELIMCQVDELLKNTLHAISMLILFQVIGTCVASKTFVIILEIKFEQD